MTGQVGDLPPELEATIEATIDEFDRSVTEAKLHDDPFDCPSRRWGRFCGPSGSFT
jgi:hypothetical protein